MVCSNLQQNYNRLKHGIMRHTLKYISIALLVAAFTAAPVYAQNYEQTPITISKEKVKNNGKLYYSHVVLEKQTLYSISKAYNVTVEEIYEANPTQNLQTEGLKKNAILLIPIKDGVTPGTTTQTSAPAAANSSDFFYHTVKWFEDLKDIAEKYGTTEEVLMAFNGMKTKTVNKKDKIKIPRNPQSVLPATSSTIGESKPAEEVAPKTETETVVEEDQNPNKSILPSILGSIFGNSSSKDNVSATLMLPFNAQGHVSENDMDFYSGVLMAVKDITSKGTGVDLNVYDVATSMPITRERLAESDIIIGPSSNNDINKVLTLCPDDKHIISPLNLKGEELANVTPQVIQKPTPLTAQYKDIFNWIKEEKKGADKFIVITEKGAKSSTVTTAMTAALNESGLQFTSLSYGILEGRNIGNNLTSMMNIDAVNHVVIISDSEAFVNDAVRNLSLMAFKKYNVALYAPAKIRSFDTIDVEDFHKVHLHVSMSYYIDYNDAKVKEFLHTYRALYNTEPSPYAFQGYDTATYFINACAQHGDNWADSLSTITTSGLQTNFKFQQTPNGGYINQGVRRIIYEEDYSVSLKK